MEAHLGGLCIFLVFLVNFAGFQLPMASQRHRVSGTGPISTCYNNTLRPTLRPFATRAWSVGAAIVGPDRTQKLVNVRGWFKRNLGCFNLKLCFGLGLPVHVGRKHSIRICGLWWTVWVLLGSTVCGVKVAPRIIAPSVRNYGLGFRV